MENSKKIRVFGSKTGIWSARNTQKNKGKPSVITVWWIDGPNGAENGQKVNEKLVFFDPLLDSPSESRTGSPRPPREAPREADQAPKEAGGPTLPGRPAARPAARTAL